MDVVRTATVVAFSATATQAWNNAGYALAEAHHQQQPDVGMDNGGISAAAVGGDGDDWCRQAPRLRADLETRLLFFKKRS